MLFLVVFNGSAKIGWSGIFYNGNVYIFLEYYACVRISSVFFIYQCSYWAICLYLQIVHKSFPLLLSLVPNL